jgi:hypothetical protein
MSKIKVNNIEAASGSTITIPSGQTLDIAGTIQGGGLSTAITNAISGYDDGSGGDDSNTYYDFSFISSPLGKTAEDNFILTDDAQVDGTLQTVVTSTQQASFLSLLSRKKFVNGVLVEVASGCGEFFQYANVGYGISLAIPWLGVGFAPSGFKFPIGTPAAEGRGDATLTHDTTLPWGQFSTPLESAGSERGLARWIYDSGSLSWFYVTGGSTRGASSKTVGGGWWMWSEGLGWHWSRADIFPHHWVNTPYNWTSGSGVTGDAVGWTWWKPNATFNGRSTDLYIYSSGKWVTSNGTGAAHPLANANAGNSGSGQSSSTPTTDAPDEPVVVIESQ